jgi:hypothetical protein
MELGAAETLQPVRDMAKIKHIYCVVKPVIKDFPRIVTPSLYTPIMAGKPLNALFWLLPNLTASGGQQESLN